MKYVAVSVILGLAVTLASAASISPHLQEEWELFKITHGKTYTEVEEKFRMQVFLDNRQGIARHNTRHLNGEVSYTLAMNKYGDLVSSILFLIHINIAAEDIEIVDSFIMNSLLP